METRDESANWQIIVADDGSTDGTVEYLKELQKTHDLSIIFNQKTGIHRQTNTIIQTLSQLDFDCCFNCDDDVLFKQKGWDNLYWNTIKRNGYDHLIFYDKNWRPAQNLERPIEQGRLIANCKRDDIQGGFYTLTKRLLQEVGYFDEQLFGRSGLGHLDFSFRCCRTGFNVLANPFDVVNSNDFLQLQPPDNYQSSVSARQKSAFETQTALAQKRKLLTGNRIFIPFNENDLIESKKAISKELSEVKNGKAKNYRQKLRKADATFYSDRGVAGFVGFLLKRFYNLLIDLRLVFFAKGMKKMGRTLNKLSLDLMNIDA